MLVFCAKHQHQVGDYIVIIQTAPLWKGKVRQLTASINWVCLRKMWMWGHFNQSGYEEESAGQNVFMGMKCHDHVSKEVGRRKKNHQAHLILFVCFLKPTIEVIS